MVDNTKMTTMRVSWVFKEWLKGRKVHPRESDSECCDRLMGGGVE